MDTTDWCGCKKNIDIDRLCFNRGCIDRIYLLWPFVEVGKMADCYNQRGPYFTIFCSLKCDMIITKINKQIGFYI